VDQVTTVAPGALGLVEGAPAGRARLLETRRATTGEGAAVGVAGNSRIGRRDDSIKPNAAGRHAIRLAGAGGCRAGGRGSERLDGQAGGAHDGSRLIVPPVRTSAFIARR
jgi:hypothetical protein